MTNIARVVVKITALESVAGQPVPDIAIQDALHFIKLDMQKGATEGSVTVCARSTPGAYGVVWGIVRSERAQSEQTSAVVERHSSEREQRCSER